MILYYQLFYFSVPSELNCHTHISGVLRSSQIVWLIFGPVVNVCHQNGLIYHPMLGYLSLYILFGDWSPVGACFWDRNGGGDGLGFLPLILDLGGQKLSGQHNFVVQPCCIVNKRCESNWSLCSLWWTDQSITLVTIILWARYKYL